MNHTPGPWKLKECMGGGAIIERAANLSNQILPIEDAYLIAAAPELLEALKAFVDMNPINEKEMFIAVTNAKLAIAKAEGK